MRNRLTQREENEDGGKNNYFIWLKVDEDCEFLMEYQINYQNKENVYEK